MTLPLPEILKDFTSATSEIFLPLEDRLLPGVMSGIYCDVIGTLVLSEKNGAKVLNTDLQDFLLWCRSKEIPVVIFSSDVETAQRELKRAGSSPLLLSSVENKLAVYQKGFADEKALEIVIDDDPIGSSFVFIHPDNKGFRDFLKNRLYEVRTAGSFPDFKP